MLSTSNKMQAFTQVTAQTGESGYMRQMPGRISHPSQEAQVKEMGKTNNLTKKIFGITLLVLFVAILMFTIEKFLGEDISRGGHSAVQEKLEIIIGNDVLHIPANFIRYSNQRREGIHQRLELYIHWPSMSGYRDELQNAFNLPSEQSNLIFLTLEKRSMAYDMSGRISPIYERFFEGNPIHYKAGLVKQNLSSEAGFIDEDLYYAAGSPYPFAARCVKENSSVGTAYCLRDIHIAENLSLTYRFHKRMLEDWISIENKLRDLMKTMLVKQAGS